MTGSSYLVRTSGGGPSQDDKNRKDSGNSSRPAEGSEQKSCKYGVSFYDLNLYVDYNGQWRKVCVLTH